MTPTCTTGKPAARARPRVTGFTLVELLVVLVIIATLAAVAVPSMSGALQSTALRESAQRLVLTARYARSYAITHGCECRLTFDTAANTYALTYRPDPDEDRFEPVVGGGRTHRLERGVKFGLVRAGSGESGGVITFLPTGEADASAVQVTDGSRVFTLLVAERTGRVTLHEGEALEAPRDWEDLDA
jgi:prepilin-type N-terminal cleavage/methylation domain-containing protein